MSSARFFLSEDGRVRRVGNLFDLPSNITHHATRVLRLQVGSSIRLFDGRGGECHAVIERVDRKGASVRIERFDPVEREWVDAPTLVQALIAGDPMDAAVRKSVELGVAAIQPVVAERSQGTLAGARGAKRVAHWRAIAIAACEQCGRNRVPEVAEPMAFDAWLRDVGGAAGAVAIAGPGAATSLVSYAARTKPRAIVIGPEGGFTDGEMALAVARGLVPVHLGPRVLRADTAAVAALAMLAAVGGDAR